MNFVLKVFMIVYAVSEVVGAEGEPKCGCGVFKSPTPQKTLESPVLTKSPNFPIQCELDGKQTCSQMCIALAEAAKESGPKVLCETLGSTSEPFVPLIYSKSCGEAEWVNTGLSSNVQVCCANKAVVPCKTN